MTKDYIAISAEQDSRAANLFRGHTEAMRAHRQTMKAAQEPKALTPKVTELMALAISITQRCEGCLIYHTKEAHRQGTSRQELLDTIAVAIEMGGGPATVYGASALEAFDQFDNK